MRTKIEWVRNADGLQGESWNPLRAQLIDGNPNASKSGHHGTGCTKVSAGCLKCYASDINRRFYGNAYSYQSKPSGFYLDDGILAIPQRRKKPTTFFVGSMTDIFHEAVPAILQERLLEVMQECPQHLFLLLTKRPGSMRDSLNVFYADREIPVMPHVWCGVSAENQETADQRIPTLLELSSAVRFVSCEPLLGPINISGNGMIDWRTALDWVIVGGESGLGARPMDPEWARDLRDQCSKVALPFFFKQWGGRNKKAAGRLLDGVEWNQMPERAK